LRRILITGASGSIGRKLRAHLEGRGGYELVSLCLNPHRDPAVRTADLAVWDEAWVRAFAGVDTVIHLAGDPSPQASWASVQRLNLDLLLNVFEAAAQHHCRRLVFASSNWTMAGHRFEDGPLRPDQPPAPVNPYGASKLFGERVGRSFAERRGLSTICLRIGYCQHSPGNLPGPRMGYNRWGQSMWLSDADLCQGFEKAILAPDELRFAVLNLMSEVEGMRWDLGPTRDAIGYVPESRHTPEVTAEMAAHEEASRKARDLITSVDAFIHDQHW
jgi:nucleoside-diphosphate-sugar epimerase